MAQSRVRETLQEIGAIDPSRVVRFAERTRDRDIPVWVDPVTGVIFIDEYYVGDAEYATGSYREMLGVPDFEDWSDTLRRTRDFRPLAHGRSILDFGCGAGSFLRGVRGIARSVQGVELQESFREQLNDDGIPCYDDLNSCTPSDVAFMFHVLEHLPDPRSSLERMHDFLGGNGGTLVVEVPHARDFLISTARNQPFIDFTLWSQHLVLHTRESLDRLLRTAGFTSVQVRGVQRYGLANHLNWLIGGQPGGHKGHLAAFESAALRQEWEAALAAMDATDTLVAIAS